MRNRSRDELEPSDHEDEGGEMPEGRHVDVDLDPGIDVGFDFLEDPNERGRKDPNGRGAGPGTAKGLGGHDDGMSMEDVAEFRARWADVQASFIDDPHRACEGADNLVDLVLKRLMRRFTSERDDLVRMWDRGNETIGTEDLRLAMRGYRSLIDRLLEAEL
ncbi:MAG: hypothetical protein ACRELC_14235 [Gemmatimonadota bacterium]